MTTKILLHADSTILSKRRHYENTTHILDLNYDCLREISQYLDLASQFALLRTSTKFLQIILYDIWYQYYDGEFDITKDQSINLRSQEFQIEFLKSALRQFTKINGIPAKLFNIYIEKSLFQNNHKNISSLTIQNHILNDADDSIILNMKEFLKFSNLQELYIENVKIKFDPTVNFHSLKTVSLTTYILQGDIEGSFLKNIFSKNIEILVLKPYDKHFVAISFDNFSQISQCVNLKELTIYSYHLSDPKFLDLILSLPNLTTLTIQCYDSYFFASNDHNIFYGIMKILYEIPNKTLEAFEIYGMPNRFFFQCPFLEDIPNLSWMVTKIFHRHLDGTLEWKSDICHIIQSFYNFISNSKYLQNLFVGNNIFHKKRIIKELNFIEKIQQQRCEKGIAKLKFINNIKSDTNINYFNTISEGSVRFFIKNFKSFK